MFKIFKSFTKGRGTAGKPEEKPTPAPSAPAKVAAPAAAKTAPKPVPAKSPEEICAVDAKMSKDDIRARLAVLYKRYNRATSSLDAKLRAEAETMLDAVVSVREKYLGPI